MFVNTFFEKHVEQLFELAERLCAALSEAGIEHRIVGGLAVYIHVNRVDPMAARLTRDIDVAVNRRDLEAIAKAARKCGLRYRHAAGVDLLVDADDPRAARGVHLVFVGEKVRPQEPEPVPDFSLPAAVGHDLPVASVADLVKMKLTGFRLKDQVHIQDLDAAGLITPAMEAQLTETLRERLRQVRRSR